MSVKVEILKTGSGNCCLTGKEECDGLTVSFEDGTVKESHLSWKAFRQLLGMKAGQQKPESHPNPTSPVVPAGNTVK